MACKAKVLLDRLAGKRYETATTGGNQGFASIAGQHVTTAQEILREALAAASIRHENVVSVYSVDEEPIPFLTMEFIGGQNLQERVDDSGPLELREVLSIGRQLFAGLEAAHAAGIIHRDIKRATFWWRMVADCGSRLRTLDWPVP